MSERAEIVGHGGVDTGWRGGVSGTLADDPFPSAGAYVRLSGPPDEADRPSADRVPHPHVIEVEPD